MVLIHSSIPVVHKQHFKLLGVVDHKLKESIGQDITGAFVRP